MSRSRETSPDDRRGGRTPIGRWQLVAGAAAGVLAIVAPGCGSGSGKAAKDGHLQSRAAGLSRPRYNAYTEARLKSIIRPTMAEAADYVITSAGEHPGLSIERVGKRAVYLTVRDIQRYRAPDGGSAVTSDVMRLASRRAFLDGTPDPDAALAVSVSRFTRFAEHPDDNFISAIDLYAPGGARLPVGEGNLHTDGWAAQERLATGPEAVPDTEPLYDSSGGLQTERGKSAQDPLAAARNVALDTLPLVHFTESDFKPDTAAASAGR